MADSHHGNENLMLALPNIIDQLGTSWKLTVQEFAVYSYNHPTFGYLEYVGREAWLCDNTNTVWLTQQGTLPDGVLPKSICIRPKYDGVCGCYDKNWYPTPEDACLCADNGCPQKHTLWLRCGNCFESDTQTISRGGDPGVLCPDNPSYTMEAVLCGQTLRVTWYCCGADGWYADITLNGNFCESFPLGQALTRCPLTIATGASDACAPYFIDCSCGCIGIDAECPPCEEPACCDDEPTELTATVDSTCTLFDGLVFTATGGAGSHVWNGTADAGAFGTAVIEIRCTEGSWECVLSHSFGLSCDFLLAPADSQSCDPIELTFSGVLDDLAECTCQGDTATVTVTE